MDFLSLVLIGIALSMDAMAVAISSGIVSKRIDAANVVRLAFFFGFFQFAMPLAGWFLGSRVSVYVEAVDHWIALALLCFIGIRMIVGAIREKENHTKDSGFGAKDPFAFNNLLLMAIATSIDAFAVGVSFALTNVAILRASLLIGVITFLLSAFGVLIGKKVGRLFKERAEILGGVILICIGVKIVVEHLYA